MDGVWEAALSPLWAEAANQGEGGILQLLLGPGLPFLMIGILAYLMFFRPENRRRAEFSKLMEGLKKNDRVITAGGIYGTVVNVQQGSEDVTLRIDDNNNIRIRVLRSSITRVVSGEDGGEASKPAE